MKIAFFVSSIGDTDLALETIKSLEKKGEHEALLISLTKAAQQRVENVHSASLVGKHSLSEILALDFGVFSEGRCTEEQLRNILQYIHLQKIDHAYFGVPSTNNEIPFQIARLLDGIPILMAYEFMFKPENHCLWTYLPELKSKSNIHWALSLPDALEDFGLHDKVHVIGHMSIDNAFAPKSSGSKSLKDINHSLQVFPHQSLAFVSSTTQPVEIDTRFLDCLLTELPNHPNVQVRLGIHPGIQDLDAYLVEILAVYKKNSEVLSQFKIILPDNLLGRFKKPELSISNLLFHKVFLRADINGSEAASAACRVAQAVPGALLNQSVLEGKPAYSHLGKPYLPRQYFADSIVTFFSEERQQPRMKEALGLDEKTAPERCAHKITLNLLIKTAHHH